MAGALSMTHDSIQLDSSQETAIIIFMQATLFHAVWKKWHCIDVVIANAGVVDQQSKCELRVDADNLLANTFRSLIQFVLTRISRGR